eukprot:11174456-Lingulodinium_polyedra.AAC.1
MPPRASPPRCSTPLAKLLPPSPGSCLAMIPWHHLAPDRLQIPSPSVPPRPPRLRPLTPKQSPVAHMTPSPPKQRDDTASQNVSCTHSPAGVPRTP